MLFCTIIVVIMSNLIRKITQYMLCSVPSCDVQQTFFLCLSKGRSQLSKLSIQNKLVLKMLFFTIIVVKILNLIQKITLYMVCSVPSCDVQQTFFFCLSKGRSQLSKLSIWNKLVLKMLFCAIIVERTSKIIRKINLTFSRHFLLPFREHSQLSKLSSGNKLVLKMLFCTFIVVIVLN